MTLLALINKKSTSNKLRNFRKNVVNCFLLEYNGTEHIKTDINPKNEIFVETQLQNSSKMSNYLKRVITSHKRTIVFLKIIIDIL